MQVAADDALTAAIGDVLQAYDFTSSNEVLAEYAIVTASRIFEDDGDVNDSMTVLGRDNSVPIHALIGLFRYGQVSAEAGLGVDLDG